MRKKVKFGGGGAIIWAGIAPTTWKIAPTAWKIAPTTTKLKIHLWRFSDVDMRVLHFEVSNEDEIGDNFNLMDANLTIFLSGVVNNLFHVKYIIRMVWSVYSSDMNSKARDWFNYAKQAQLCSPIIFTNSLSAENSFSGVRKDYSTPEFKNW